MDNQSHLGHRQEQLNKDLSSVHAVVVTSPKQKHVDFSPDISPRKPTMNGSQVGSHNKRRGSTGMQEQRELVRTLHQLKSASGVREDKPHILYSSKKPVAYDILGSYTIYNNTDLYEHKDFHKVFLEARKQFKSELYKNFQEMTYQQLSGLLQPLFDIPQLLDRNRNLWALKMMKTSQVQNVIASFSNRLEDIVMTEIAQNKTLIVDFLNTTRHPKEYQVLDTIETIISASKHIRLSRPPIGYTAQKRKEALYNKIDKQMKIIRKQEADRQEHEDQIKAEQERKQRLLKEIAAKVQEIDKLTDEIENQNIEANQNLEMCQEEQRNTQKKLINPPSERLKDIIEEWAMQPVDTNEEIEQLRGELWFTLEEFEKKLENDITSYKIEREQIINFYKKKVQQTKITCAFHIETLERALLEYKLINMQQTEQTEMMLNDYQSRLLNDFVQDDNIDKIIERAQQCEGLIEAKKQISLMIKLLRNLHNQLLKSKELNIQLTGQVQSMTDKISTHESRAYELMILIGNMKDTFKKMTEMINCDKVNKEIDEVVQRAFDFWDMTFLEGKPEVPPSFKLLQYLATGQSTNGKTQPPQILTYDQVNFAPVFEQIEDLNYLKDSILTLRKSMKNSKHYLVEEIWPKPPSIFGMGAENQEKKTVTAFMKDERVMKVIGVNPQTDEVQTQLAFPQKFKPNIPALANQKVVYQKLSSTLGNALLNQINAAASGTVPTTGAPMSGISGMFKKIADFQKKSGSFLRMGTQNFDHETASNITGGSGKDGEQSVRGESKFYKQRDSGSTIEKNSSKQIATQKRSSVLSKGPHTFSPSKGKKTQRFNSHDNVKHTKLKGKRGGSRRPSINDINEETDEEFFEDRSLSSLTSTASPLEKSPLSHHMRSPLNLKYQNGSKSKRQNSLGRTKSEAGALEKQRNREEQKRRKEQFRIKQEEALKKMADQRLLEIARKMPKANGKGEVEVKDAVIQCKLEIIAIMERESALHVASPRSRPKQEIKQPQIIQQTQLKAVDPHDTPSSPVVILPLKSPIDAFQQAHQSNEPKMPYTPKTLRQQQEIGTKSNQHNTPIVQELLYDKNINQVQLNANRKTIKESNDFNTQTKNIEIELINDGKEVIQHQLVTKQSTLELSGSIINELLVSKTQDSFEKIEDFGQTASPLNLIQIKQISEINFKPEVTITTPNGAEKQMDFSKQQKAPPSRGSTFSKRRQSAPDGLQRGSQLQSYVNQPMNQSRYPLAEKLREEAWNTISQLRMIMNSVSPQSLVTIEDNPPRVHIKEQSGETKTKSGTVMVQQQQQSQRMQSVQSQRRSLVMQRFSQDDRIGENVVWGKMFSDKILSQDKSSFDQSSYPWNRTQIYQGTCTAELEKLGITALNTDRTSSVASRGGQIKLPISPILQSAVQQLGGEIKNEFSLPRMKTGRNMQITKLSSIIGSSTARGFANNTQEYINEGNTVATLLDTTTATQSSGTGAPLRMPVPLNLVQQNAVPLLNLSQIKNFQTSKEMTNNEVSKFYRKAFPAIKTKLPQRGITINSNTNKASILQVDTPRSYAVGINTDSPQSFANHQEGTSCPPNGKGKDLFQFRPVLSKQSIDDGHPSLRSNQAILQSQY